eukprot:UC4_evm1s334
MDTDFLKSSLAEPLAKSISLVAATRPNDPILALLLRHEWNEKNKKHQKSQYEESFKNALKSAKDEAVRLKELRAEEARLALKRENKANAENFLAYIEELRTLASSKSKSETGAASILVSLLCTRGIDKLLGAGWADLAVARIQGDNLKELSQTSLDIARAFFVLVGYSTYQVDSWHSVQHIFATKRIFSKFRLFDINEVTDKIALARAWKLIKGVEISSGLLQCGFSVPAVLFMSIVKSSIAASGVATKDLESLDTEDDSKAPTQTSEEKEVSKKESAWILMEFNIKKNEKDENYACADKLKNAIAKRDFKITYGEDTFEADNTSLKMGRDLGQVFEMKADTAEDGEEPKKDKEELDIKSDDFLKMQVHILSTKGLSKEKAVDLVSEDPESEHFKTLRPLLNSKLCELAEITDDRLESFKLSVSKEHEKDLNKEAEQKSGNRVLISGESRTISSFIDTDTAKKFSPGAAELGVLSNDLRCWPIIDTKRMDTNQSHYMIKISFSSTGVETSDLDVAAVSFDARGQYVSSCFHSSEPEVSGGVSLIEDFEFPADPEPDISESSTESDETNNAAKGQEATVEPLQEGETTQGTPAEGGDPEVQTEADEDTNNAAETEEESNSPSVATDGDAVEVPVPTSYDDAVDWSLMTAEGVSKTKAFTLDFTKVPDNVTAIALTLNSIGKDTLANFTTFSVEARPISGDDLSSSWSDNFANRVVFKASLKRAMKQEVVASLFFRARDNNNQWVFRGVAEEVVEMDITNNNYMNGLEVITEQLSLSNLINSDNEDDGVNPFALMKGQSIRIPNKVESGSASVLIGWKYNPKDQMDFDLMAIMYSEDGVQQDYVDFEKLEGCNGVISHGGDNRTGEDDAGKSDKDGIDGANSEIISINLSKIPANINSIIFVAAIYEGGSLTNVNTLRARLQLAEEERTKEVCQFALSQFEKAQSDTAVLLARITRAIDDEKPVGWNFFGLGDGVKGRTVEQIAPVIADRGYAMKTYESKEEPLLE